MDQNNKQEHEQHVLPSADQLKKHGDKRYGSKKWLTVILLVVVLGAAIGGYWLLSRPEAADPNAAEVTPAPTSSMVALLEKERDQVKSVDVTVRDGEAFTLLYDGANNRYSIAGKENFEVNPDEASALITYACQLNAAQMVQENVTDMEQFGLKTPAVSFTANYTDGTSKTYFLGDKTPATSAYYLCEKGGSTVYLVYSAVYNAYNRNVNSLHTLPAISIDSAAISGLVVERKGKDTVELTMNGENTDPLSISTLRLEQPFLYDANSDRANEVLTAAAALNVSGYAGRVDDGKDYGLTEPTARIAITTTTEVQVPAETPAPTAEPAAEATAEPAAEATAEPAAEATAEPAAEATAEPEPEMITKQVAETRTFTIGSRAEDGKVYCTVDESGAVYLMDESLLSFLDKAKAPYLVDQFINLVSIFKVDGIVIEDANGGKYEMGITREPVLNESGEQELDNNGNPKTNDTYTFNGTATTDSLFKKMYQEIIGTLADKLLEETPPVGDTVLRITYKLNIAPGELVIEYQSYDDDYYVARRGDTARFLIKKSKVDSVLESCKAYAEGTYTED